MKLLIGSQKKKRHDKKRSMTSISFLFFSAIIFSNIATAQIEKTELFYETSLNPGLYPFRVSVSFIFKVQFNITETDAIMTSVSFTRWSRMTDFIPPFNTEFDMLPLLVGYKHQIKRIYVEPQIGAGIFSKTVNYDGEHEKVFADAAFYWGAETGYKISRRFRGFIKYHRLNTINNSFSANKFGYGGIGVSVKLD